MFNKATHKIVLKLCTACILSSGLIYDEVQDKRCVPATRHCIFRVYFQFEISRFYYTQRGR